MNSCYQTLIFLYFLSTKRINWNKKVFGGTQPIYNQSSRLYKYKFKCLQITKRYL